MKKGTRVKYVNKETNLGVMETPNDTKFIGTLGRDFVGIYEGPHDNPRLSDWHITTVAISAVEPANEYCDERIEELIREHGRQHRLYVVVHKGQIEPVDPPTTSLGSLLP